MVDLKTRFEQAADDYQHLKEICEEDVIRWEWTDEPRYKPQPYYFLRECFYRGQILDAEPVPIKGQCQYGFDQYDRIVVTREYVGDMGKYETFTRYMDDLAESVHYSHSPKKPLIYVARQHFDCDRIVKYETYTPKGQSVELYEYERELLSRINITHGRAPQLSVEILEYDEAGQVTRIQRRDSDGVTYTLYQRPGAWQTIEAMSVIAEKRLIELIPKIVEQVGIREKVYCMCITYPDIDYWPPLWLSFGQESYRQDWMQGKVEKVWHKDVWESQNQYVMDDANFLSVLEKDAELSRINAVFDQELKLAELFDVIPNILNRVACALMKVDWSGKLDRTQDFVIYAVDLEMNDLEENLKACVPPALLAELRDQGFLPGGQLNHYSET